ncbi:MAG TPA: SsrA-binding protein SmpB [Tichowtungia sp.]|nr:SsrA-binding protein SmpB [Tichowtungia sp.]
MGKKKKSGSAPGVIATNRKARRDFQILDDLEAGIELRGTEVKSVRQGHVQIDQAYVQIKNGQAELLQLTIQPYEHGNIFNHDPTRPRRLLMHKQEIRRLESKINEKGLTLIPLKIYLKKGKVKVKVALCKGKDAVDKRETLKQKTADLEARRAMRNAR